VIGLMISVVIGRVIGFAVDWHAGGLPSATRACDRARSLSPY
jgi:hypothetical protein